MDIKSLKALVLYEDDNLLVLNKPAGLLVHPVAPDSVALTHFIKPLWPQARLAHRLDRETSGCLLLGKNTATLKNLGRWFAQGQIGKQYCAWVSPVPVGEAGEINIPIKKVAARMRPHPQGQVALTLWTRFMVKDERAFLNLNPKTGRTHQLRAHCAAMGWPILGDLFYGGGGANRLMLHAYKLVLPTGLTISADYPEDFNF